MFTKLHPRYNSSPINDNRVPGLVALNTLGVSQPLSISGLQLTTANALAVAMVDGTGAQITSFGGGTQYVNGVANASPTGTLALGYDGANLRAIKTASDGTLAMPTVAVTGTFWQATQPVTLASTTITGTVAVTQSTSPWIVAGGGTAGTAAAAVVTVQGIAGMTKLLVTPDSVALPANQSVNVAQINGVTPLMGNGTTGTGSQRVTIASDNTAFSVNATLSAETTKVIGTVNIAASQTIAVTNTGTFAVQATPVTQADTFMLGGVNVKEINGVAPLMGSGTNGTGAQRITIATDQAALSVAGVFSVKLDQTTPGTTNAVSLAQIGGTTIVNGGTAGTQSVGGIVANNGTINSAVNPILIGGQAVSSENAANTTAKLSQFVTDLVGKLIVLPYANPENFVSGVITSAMTGTTSTSLLAAPAAGLRNYITQITVSNAHATVGTDMIIQDGNGGTTLYNIPAAAVYGGAALTFPTPLRQPTTATAIYIANVTTGASTKASASGYKGI